MKIVVFTSNAPRHRYVANLLARKASQTLVVSEARPSDVPPLLPPTNPVEENFYQRYLTEAQFFGADPIQAETLPLLYKEANRPFVADLVKSFGADMFFCFGASIIKEPIISMLPPGRFVNMHLGISPYYRGANTNFWPFINEELEYVGATLLHLDAGIDTGDIICHVRPTIEQGDTVHTIGNKVIKAGAEEMARCLEIVKRGGTLQRVPQWKPEKERYYKTADFSPEIYSQYEAKIASGLIERHLAKKQDSMHLIAPQSLT